MCDTLYLNPLDNFNNSYTPYEDKIEEKTTVRLNTVILTKVKVKSINYVSISVRSLNNLRGDAIRLGDVYVCD